MTAIVIIALYIKQSVRGRVIMDQKYIIMLLNGMIFFTSISMRAEQQSMVEKLRDGVAWVADSRGVHIAERIVNIAATIGGLAFVVVIIRKISLMRVMGFDYDENAYLISSLGTIEKSATYAHGRINMLEDLPTNRREIKNLFK